MQVTVMAQLGNGNSYSDGGSDDSCPGNKLMIVLVTIYIIIYCSEDGHPCHRNSDRNNYYYDQTVECMVLLQCHIIGRLILFSLSFPAQN